MPAQIRIRTFASAPIIHPRRRCVHFPVRHTLRFIAIAPIASLAHVTLLLEHLLLRPDTMALRVVPCASRGGRGAVAVLVAQLERDGNADADSLGDGAADFKADARRARLAHLSAGEGGNHAVGSAGAVGVARGLSPRLIPLLKLKKERKEKAEIGSRFLSLRSQNFFSCDFAGGLDSSRFNGEKNER